MGLTSPMFPDVHSFAGHNKKDQDYLPLLVTIFHQVRVKKAHIILENFTSVCENVFGRVGASFGYDYMSVWSQQNMFSLISLFAPLTGQARRYG